jgi:uncharacterized protein YxjI
MVAALHDGTLMPRVTYRSPAPLSGAAREGSMRYLMRERLLSWGDDFRIRTEDGEDAYVVDGKVFAMGDSLTFKDRHGRELARIEQKLLSLKPQYEIIRDGTTVAVVKKQFFSLFRTRFTVDVPGPDDLEATGDFLDHEYTFTRGGAEVARVSKRFLSLRDTYTIDVVPGADDVLVLAAAVVIDLVSHPDEDS